MKLSTDKRDVTKSQEFETMQYGVDASNLPLLFQLLRTNLYSDLPGSIMRELVSNVVDSHTEAGKPDALGEVDWIPSSKLLGQDCELVIRDFGIGLSPERMKTVYGNYLSSTKREDNSSIGGFGLGSKVPFAYTDSFSVQTIYNGIKYRYLCYIDASQLGAISLLTQEPTKEENQTEIIIPIKNEQRDYPLFQNAVNTQLAYFKNIRYKGFTQPDLEIKFEDNVCILKAVPPMQELHVVLGNVAYEIDPEALGIHQTDWYNNGYATCGLGLKFGIGELQPTMSRESLFWNESTKKKVLEKIAQARKSVRNRIQIELGNTKDYGKWFGYVANSSTESFTNQWEFAQVKGKGEMIYDGVRLPIVSRFTEWFAGHNIRKVTPHVTHSWRTRSGEEPDYNVAKPMDQDFANLPIYRLDRNLNAGACLFLFRTHKDGFLAISELGEPDTADAHLRPYYEATKKWAITLPDFDAIDVPYDAPQGMEDERARQYREMVKNRKLQGKFTAKRMRPNYDMYQDLEASFIYNMFEAKFEDMKNHTIIYGFQEEHKKMCEIAATLSYSYENWNRFTKHLNTGGHTKPITILKIGQNYEKQFFAMPNAYHVEEVLSLQTPFNETFASITTAIKIKPYLHLYHTLDYFGSINGDLCNKYKAMHTFVEQYTVKKNCQSAQLENRILTRNLTNVNNEFESDWVQIQEYFDGVELLKSVNFAFHSSEHRYQNNYGQNTGRTEGSSVAYIKNWVHQSQASIIDYLILKGKDVDGHTPDSPLVRLQPELVVEYNNVEDVVPFQELQQFLTVQN